MYSVLSVISPKLNNIELVKLFIQHVPTKYVQELFHITNRKGM